MDQGKKTGAEAPVSFQVKKNRSEYIRPCTESKVHKTRSLTIFPCSPTQGTGLVLLANCYCRATMTVSFKR
jgi:hypothetical protein